MWGGVPLGSGRPGQGGSMREGLAACPGWGEATALGPLCGPLPTVQLPLILNSWHIIGIQALVVLSIGHGAPRSSPLACLNTTRDRPTKVLMRMPTCRYTHNKAF